MAAWQALIPDDLAARMIALRRHLHANPELSNEEVETQRHLRQALEAEGLGPVRCCRRNRSCHRDYRRHPRFESCAGHPR